MANFRKILIANRGEIACRVILSARAKGYRTVAVYSDADIGARHVGMADEAVHLGPAAAGESYLNIDRVLAAATRSGADAVHPGYGFLSENAQFAQACGDAGLTFIGPSPEAIRVMGDKAEAKRRMIAAGVPCIPGYQGEDQADERLVSEAAAIGFPVMVKAAAGGGGRGMRLVHVAGDLVPALRSARSEATNAFGDGRLLLERAVIQPRHVEIQVFGDSHGHVVHLGERDCSIQRRHQKVVEEAPSPAVDAELRARMGAAAVLAAQTIAYVGAGTVEFLLDRNGSFFFLEMNTRLQVEHPVTELVTGLDLVALQLDVARGKHLPIQQEDVALRGHAIEVRLYAEDPANTFLPQTGSVKVWRPSAAEGIRTDAGISAGSEISAFYDPMIAKIIAWGQDRDEARRRLVAAVADTTILGVTTNKEFLGRILDAPLFAGGHATTAFIETEFPNGFAALPTPDFAWPLAAALFADEQSGGWQSSTWLESVLVLEENGTEHRCHVSRAGDSWNVRTADGETAQLRILMRSQHEVRFETQGHIRSAAYARDGDTLHLDCENRVLVLRDRTFAPPVTTDSEASGTLRAPMTGLVVSLSVAVGDVVVRGQVLAVLEAMKMEHQIVAPANGVVEAIGAAFGAQVTGGDLLVRLEVEETA